MNEPGAEVDRPGEDVVHGRCVAAETRAPLPRCRVRLIGLGFVLLVVFALGAACRTAGMRERFGGLWSDELVDAARYLPADFEACRITTATLLDHIEELPKDARLLSLTATRWSAREKYEWVQITYVGHVARLPLDHPDRLERQFQSRRPEKVGRAGEVDLFHVDVSGELLDYRAEVDGLSFYANDLDILRDALSGLGSLDAVVRCCPFPPLDPGAELLQVVRVDRNGVRAFATYATRERPEEMRVVIDADDLAAARQYVLARAWSDDTRQHARDTEDGVIVAVPRRTSMEDTLVWASRVQDLSHILFFDGL